MENHNVFNLSGNYLKINGFTETSHKTDVQSELLLTYSESGGGQNKENQVVNRVKLTELYLKC